MRQSYVWIPTLVALLALSACQGQNDLTPESQGGVVPADAAAQSATALPDGHPMVPADGPASASDVIPQLPPGAGEGRLGMTWQAPDGWLEETPSSEMRQAQWRVPGESGDGECVIFYFGPGQGGDAMANAHRWASQFTLADGRPGPEGTKLDEREVDGLSLVVVEVAGTYNPGMPFAARPNESRDQQMLLGAIVQGPDANWFVKCTGPEQTLTEGRAGFDALLSSFKTNAPLKTTP